MASCHIISRGRGRYFYCSIRLIPLMSNSDDNWSLYIIEASDRSLYTGITTDIERRFAEHLSGPKGARFFNNGRQPLRVVYRETGLDRSSASRREAAIKKMSRREKETLIARQRSLVLR